MSLPTFKTNQTLNGLDKGTTLFFLLGGFFIANALVAEFIGVKIFALEDTLGIPRFNIQLFGQQGALQFSAGVLLWPVVFLMTDIINEYFGKQGVRKLSFFTAGLIAYAFLIIFFAIQLVPADWWMTQNKAQGVENMQTSFQVIFGQGILMVFGSLTAFLVAQLVDVLLFHQIKKVTGEKRVWLRSTGSTFVSQFFDSFVILTIAFKWGPELAGTVTPWSWDQILAVGTIQYIYKISMAVLLTPVIYGVHHIIDNYLGKEESSKMKGLAAL
ncbi:MAG: hypothetical protein RLZZ417_2897 [Bacteroidota bacterium]|jgi:uncharacterized integral membrane protein (TIGR00697 family)